VVDDHDVGSKLRHRLGQAAGPLGDHDRPVGAVRAGETPADPFEARQPEPP
jgi:hypothetical protein